MNKISPFVIKAENIQSVSNVNLGQLKTSQGLVVTLDEGGFPVDLIRRICWISSIVVKE